MWHLMGNTEWTEITPIICSHIVTVCKHSIIQEKKQRQTEATFKSFCENQQADQHPGEISVIGFQMSESMLSFCKGDTHGLLIHLLCFMSYRFDRVVTRVGGQTKDE